MVLKGKLSFILFVLLISCVASAGEKSKTLFLSLSKSVAEYMCKSEGSPIRENTKDERDIEECLTIFMGLSLECEKEMFNGSFPERFSSREAGFEIMGKLNKCTDDKFFGSTWYKDFAASHGVK